MLLNPWPSFDSEQICAASRVLESGKVNSWSGSECDSFENEFSFWCSSKYSIAVSNGSLALSLAYLSLNIGPNDEVITTPRTYIATASSAVLLGAVPVFADVHPESGCITAETIEPLISLARRQ